MIGRPHRQLEPSGWLSVCTFSQECLKDFTVKLIGADGAHRPSRQSAALDGENDRPDNEHGEDNSNNSRDSNSGA